MPNDVPVFDETIDAMRIRNEWCWLLGAMARRTPFASKDMRDDGVERNRFSREMIFEALFWTQMGMRMKQELTKNVTHTQATMLTFLLSSWRCVLRVFNNELLRMLMWGELKWQTGLFTSYRADERFWRKMIIRHISTRATRENSSSPYHMDSPESINIIISSRKRV